MSRIGLLKNMTIYGLGGVLAKAIQFLLLPVYTRVLEPADYGSLELAYMVISVIGILYGFLISSGYTRCYFDSRDEVVRQQLLGSAFWFTLFSSLFFLFLSFIYADRVAALIFDFENGGLFIKIISVSTTIKAHSLLFYNFLMVKERARRYVVMNIVSLVVMLIATIYFVVVLRWGVKGVLVAQLLSYSIELSIFALMLIRKTIFKYSMPAVKEMLKYSMPLMPLQLAAFILTLSDRFFLQEYRTLGDVGLYSLGYKFAAIMPLLTVEPLKAFGPYIFNLVDQPERCKQALADFSRYFMAVSMFLTLGISMFSREVIIVMSDQAFHSGYRVVFILCLSYLFYGLSNLASYAINIVKRNWIISISWFIAAGLNIALNFLFVPRYGMIGASVATAISYLAILIIKFLAIRFVYPVRFQYFHLVGLLILGAVTYGLSTLVDHGLLLPLALKAGLLAGFVAVLLFSGYFTKSERLRAREIFASLFSRRTNSH